MGTSGAPATNSEVRGNVISGNGQQGLLIDDADSTGNVVASNRIGTNPAGTAALGNSAGIEVIDADANTIGGPAPLADANLISGNTVLAVRIAGFGTERAVGNVIRNNRIGTTLNGEAALGSAFGVLLDGNVDATTVRNNLISGNTGDGIELGTNGSQSVGADGPSDNVIAGNLIGTDKDGEADLGQSGPGILLQDIEGGHPLRDNVLGGSAGLTPAGDCSGDCNLISGNNGGGIVLSGAEGGQILGNRIGTDDTGMVGLGNTQAAIEVDSSSGLTIGSPAAANLIADNGGGIRVNGPMTGTIIQSNLIGVDVAGGDLGNGADGIELQVAGINGNLIGGTGAGEGNTIANAGLAGVRVPAGSTGNSILGNSILGNNGLGIDLFGVAGVTPNDAGRRRLRRQRPAELPRAEGCRRRQLDGRRWRAAQRRVDHLPDRCVFERHPGRLVARRGRGPTRQLPGDDRRRGRRRLRRDLGGHRRRR